MLVSTGSRPRIPDWCTPDGERILTTRQCYPPPMLPEHLVVVGSGVTGVEFVHMFSTLGSKVTLIVSRQQVLPTKDPEVAAALEEDFLRRGVSLLKGARAVGHRPRRRRGAWCGATTVGWSAGRHALLAIGSVPNTEDLGLDAAGVEVDRGGYIPINHHCQSNVAHIYAAGDVSGKLPLSSVASMQGRKVAEHVMGLHTREHRHLDYDKAASAIFTEPEIADVGLAEAEAFAMGRKIRVTKVPFSAAPKALINNDPRGFVKILSDPATGVVLGGSIVGRHAAELISVHRAGRHRQPQGHRHRREPAGAPVAVRGPRRRRRVAGAGRAGRAARRRRRPAAREAPGPPAARRRAPPIPTRPPARQPPFVRCPAAPIRYRFGAAMPDEQSGGVVPAWRWSVGCWSGRLAGGLAGLGAGVAVELGAGAGELCDTPLPSSAWARRRPPAPGTRSIRSARAGGSHGPRPT